MTVRLLTAALLLSLACAPGAARADVLGWLNKRVDSLMNDGPKGDAENAQFDRYLKMLQAPGEANMTAPDSTPAPSSPSSAYQPRLTDALREIIPDGGDRDSTFFYQNVYLMGVLSAQLGFRTSLRVVGHLGEGIDPSIQLLERIQSEFKKDPGRFTVARLHQLIERAMAQVQSTHQLMVESRDVLDSARLQVQRTGDLMDRLIAEEGRLQSIPAVLGVTQTTRKGVDNLSAANNTLSSCVTHFRNSFLELKRELADLEQAAATSSWSADKQWLTDRKDRVRTLNEHLAHTIASMREAGVIVRTNLALIRLNHHGLMQVLSTLSASPLARQRRDDGGLPLAEDDGETDRARVAGLAFAKINPRLAESVGQLAALGRDMETRRTRLEEWAKGLRKWKPDPIVVDDVPDWAFTDNSIPKKNEKWTSYGMLPERESDADGMIATLERDLAIGPSRAETARVMKARRQLDETLGDDHDSTSTPIDRAELGGIPRAAAPRRGSTDDAILGDVIPEGRTPEIEDLGPSPADVTPAKPAAEDPPPPPRPAAPAPPVADPDKGYELPSWF